MRCIKLTGAEGVNFCTVRIDDSKCSYCLECVNTCPNGALTYEESVKCFMHNAYECAYCEVCIDVCPEECIEILDM